MIAEIMTDKSAMEYEMMEEGYLAKILKPAGTKNIPNNAPIAILVKDPKLIP